MKNFWIKFLASCGFIGYSPIASGTLGTAVGIGFVWITYQIISISSLSGKIIYAVICVLLTLIAIPISTRAEKIFNKKDASEIIIDECVSAFITFFLVPLTASTVIIGFLLNRFFDITKVQPARYCQDNFKAGTGVVLDDIVAGIYSYVALRCIIYLTTKNIFT